MLFSFYFFLLVGLGFSAGFGVGFAAGFFFTTGFFDAWLGWGFAAGLLFLSASSLLNTSLSFFGSGLFSVFLRGTLFLTAGFASGLDDIDFAVDGFEPVGLDPGFTAVLVEVGCIAVCCFVETTGFLDSTVGF